MTDRKLFIHIQKEDEDHFIIAGVSEDKQLWLKFPIEYQDLQLHDKLASKTPVRNAIKAIKPMYGYRKVAVKIDNGILKEYFDSEGNLCYKELPLEESVEGNTITNEDENENFFIQRIKELEAKLKINEETQLHQIEKKFVIEKFDRKLNTQNASEWMNRFETECERHKIRNDMKKIEALRFFLSGTANDWYESNLKKIGLREWLLWKDSFMLVFIDKGWSHVRKALSYRYIAGSLIDYAIVKERLCLDINPTSDEISIVNLIVVGLPIEAQEELDRETTTTTAKLFTELRKLDDIFKKEKKESLQNTINKKTPQIKPKERDDDLKKKNLLDNVKKPCFICETLGFPNRWHPTTECRNKERYLTKAKINLNEIDPETTETMKIEIDNKSLN